MTAAEYSLPRFLENTAAAEAFPGADHLGRPAGEPLVAEALRRGERIGYVFLNSDFVNSTGYSGKPIHQLIAIDLNGVIQQVLLVEHHEPIILIGIPEARIRAVLDRYVGMDIGTFVRSARSEHQVDAVSGATVSVMVMDDTILRSSIKVARRFGLGGLQAEKTATGPKASIDMDNKALSDWSTLLNEGAVSNLKLTLADINKAYEDSGNEKAAARREEGEADKTFIDLYGAVVSVPAIGLSVLGGAEYANLLKRLKPGEQAIVLAGSGRFSFKGSGYVRGGIFDRFRISHGDRSTRFRDYQHKRLRRIAADGAPDFEDVDLFYIPADAQFDPAAPWQLELLVGRQIGAVEKAFITFDMNFQMPEKYLLVPEPEVRSSLDPPEPNAATVELWMKMWALKLPEIVVLLLALGVLTLIFFFQNWLVKRPVFTDRVRIGFLIFTLFGIGWYANAQLSVVNILVVFSALANGFDWSYFLMEPLIFILWGSVFIGLLFWGRGAFCGWTCPFGALQELVNRIAKAMKVPQLTLPWGLHERLWALKYLIFLTLFGFSLHSLEWAERLAEVEPFKTAIVLKFMREWEYVVYAVAVIVPGVFIERFFCRYLCPLGAALAIPGELRIFNWLKRYRECGSPCQRCAKDCMVQAIHPEGQIDVNECLYCLHCQVVYSDEHACPVLIQKRLKRQRVSRDTSVENRLQIEEIIADLKATPETAKTEH